MNLINLPDITKISIISYLDLVSLLRLKETSKYFNHYIETNIHLIHREYRSRNKKIPRIIWTPDFYKNFKKIVLSFEKCKREKYFLNKKIDKILPGSFFWDLNDDNSVERYLYLFNNGASDYNSFRMAKSNFDDEDLFNYLYLLKNNVSPYSCEKISENSDNIDIRKFLYCFRKGESSYMSENLAKKFCNQKIDTFFFFRELVGCSSYDSEKLTEILDFNDILKYIYLLERNTPHYYCQIIVLSLKDINYSKKDLGLLYFNKFLTKQEMLEIENLS